MTADPTGANNVVAAGANAHGARSLKAKAADEFRRFVVLFLYLWILFGVFVLNQGVVMREHGINFPMLGFAFINALVFAKVMMLFEVFDPGRWLRARPLIYPILYETLLLRAPQHHPHSVHRADSVFLSRNLSLALARDSSTP